MNQLDIIRDEINQIDTELRVLFEKRMNCVEKIAQYKIANHLPIFDAHREQFILDEHVSSLQHKKWEPYYRSFLEMLLKNSKEFQKEYIEKQSL